MHDPLIYPEHFRLDMVFLSIFISVVSPLDLHSVELDLKAPLSQNGLLVTG